MSCVASDMHPGAFCVLQPHQDMRERRKEILPRKSFKPSGSCIYKPPILCLTKSILKCHPVWPAAARCTCSLSVPDSTSVPSVNTRFGLFFFLSFLRFIYIFFPLSCLHPGVGYVRRSLTVWSDCCDRLPSYCLDYLRHAARITYLVVNKTACIWSRIAALVSGLVNVYLLASLFSGTPYQIPKLLIFAFFSSSMNKQLQTNIFSEIAEIGHSCSEHWKESGAEQKGTADSES